MYHASSRLDVVDTCSWEPGNQGAGVSVVTMELRIMTDARTHVVCYSRRHDHCHLAGKFTLIDLTA